MSKRIAYIDIAKGIGILLVVLGHSDLRAFAPILRIAVYSFHMPLFFFLSGMFFKPEMPFGDLARRRFKSLAWPFFFSIFVIYFAALFFDKLGLEVLVSRVVKSFYANGYTLEWTPMWFLPALFTVNLAAWLFYRLFARVSPAWPRWLGLAGVLAAGIATLRAFVPFEFSLAGRDFSFNGLPWSLDLALVLVFFFALGREAHRALPGGWLASPWVLLASSALWLGLLVAFPARLDLDKRIWESPLANTALALAGIVMTLGLAHLLERGPAWLVNALTYLGRVSIVILIFHNPVQSYLTPKIDALLGGSVYSPLLAYPFALLAPVILVELFIRRNELLAGIYGLKEE
jgi:fucose 4-O-acetylase-like acetyltransferase